jgi:hypothetical protein
VNKGTLFIALIVQCAFLAITVFIIVLDTPQSKPPRFEGKASSYTEKKGFSGFETTGAFHEADGEIGPDPALISRIGDAE